MSIGTGMFKPPPSPPIPVRGKLEVVLNKEAAKGLHRTLGAAIDSMPEEKS